MLMWPVYHVRCTDHALSHQTALILAPMTVFDSEEDQSAMRGDWSTAIREHGHHSAQWVPKKLLLPVGNWDTQIMTVSKGY